jgi:hypothetical protein
MVYLLPYIYIYGTVRTPITLKTACVPFLKGNTKGTVRYTSVHHQLCNFGIQKVEMALAKVADIENK